MAFYRTHVFMMLYFMCSISPLTVCMGSEVKKANVKVKDGGPKATLSPQATDNQSSLTAAE